MLTREQFLQTAKSKVRAEDVDVPELGGKVRVRELTTEEVIEMTRMEQARTGNAPAYVVCKATLNASGERLFTDDDLDVLGSLPPRVLKPVSDKAIQLSQAVVAPELDGPKA